MPPDETAAALRDEAALDSLSKGKTGKSSVRFKMKKEPGIRREKPNKALYK